MKKIDRVTHTYGGVERTFTRVTEDRPDGSSTTYVTLPAGSTWLWDFAPEGFEGPPDSVLVEPVGVAA